MAIRDLQTHQRAKSVVTVSVGDSVSLAALKMRDSSVGCLVVMDQDNAIVGILSERDIVFRLIADGGNPKEICVSQAMTSPVECCTFDTNMQEVREVMLQCRIRHMPVLDNGQLAGMISLRDVLAPSLEESCAASDLAVFSMAKLAESRDPETGAHLERVRDFSVVLAKILIAKGLFPDQIDDGFVTMLYQTSVLHDIGKIGIPDHVLLKPGQLTEDEYEIMKTHAMQGAETLDFALKQFPGAKFLQMARDIAAYHHEWYDGTGYPDGLAGDEIPLSARVFAIVDVYDALVNKRVYKKAFSHDLAKSIILGRGSVQFDPRVLCAFEEGHSQFCAICDRYGNMMDRQT